MIRVLLFAGLQEKVGKSEITVQDETISIKELKLKHLAEFDMDELLETSMVAVNEEYAKEDRMVSAGDVVAFIPPVSGG